MRFRKPRWPNKYDGHWHMAFMWWPREKDGWVYWLEFRRRKWVEEYCYDCDGHWEWAI